MLAADVLVLALPIWNGQPASTAGRVFERLNAMLSEADDAGRTPLFGQVAGLAVVGNEEQLPRRLGDLLGCARALQLTPYPRTPAG